MEKCQVALCIYRAIDFSGLMFVTVIFVIAQVNGQFKICAIRDK